MLDRLFGHIVQARKHADPLQRFLSTFSQKYLGVFIGVFKGKQLWADASPNTLLIGDHGKVLRSILPTLHFYQGPMIVHDPMGEIWYATAERRNLKNTSYRLYLSFKEGCDARYNPLDEVRLGTIHETSDATIIASLLADPDGKPLADRERFWIVESQHFLTGLILHVLYSSEEKTLAGIESVLNDPRRSLEDLCKAMISTIHDPSGERGWVDSSGKPTRTSPVVAQSGKRLLGFLEDARGPIVASTVNAALSIYRDPKVAALTNRSDFSLRDIVSSPNPQTVYVVISPEDTVALAPIMQLFFGLVMAIEESHAEADQFRLPTPEGPPALVLVQDVGVRLSRLAGALSAGRRRLILTTDSLSSLFEVTKKSDAILENFPITIFFKTRDTKTASYAAKLNPELLRGDKLMRIDDSEAVVFTSNAPSLVVTFPRLANGAWWIGHEDEPSDSSPTETSAAVDSSSSPYLIDAINAKDVQFATPYGAMFLTDYWPAGKHSDLYHAAFGGVLTIQGTRYAVGLGCYRKREGETWSVIDYRNAPIPSPYQMFITPTDQDTLPRSVKPTEKIEFSRNLIGEAFVTANRELRDALLSPDGLEWHRLDYDRFTRKAQGDLTATAAVND